MSGVSASRKIAALFAQDPVHERNRDRAFSDGGGHALDVARAHVADRKNAGKARLQKVGRAGKRPLRGRQIFRREIGSGLDERVLVERDAGLEPGGAGVRTRIKQTVTYLTR